MAEYDIETGENLHLTEAFANVDQGDELAIAAYGVHTSRVTIFDEPGLIVDAGDLYGMDAEDFALLDEAHLMETQ